MTEINELDPTTLKLNDPVWLIVNGEPELRYFVNVYDDRLSRSSYVLSFKPSDDSGKNLYEYTSLYADKASVIRMLIGGLENQIRYRTLELQARQKQLEECIRGD